MIADADVMGWARMAVPTPFKLGDSEIAHVSGSSRMDGRRAGSALQFACGRDSGLTRSMVDRYGEGILMARCNSEGCAGVQTHEGALAR